MNPATEKLPAGAFVLSFFPHALRKWIGARCVVCRGKTIQAAVCPPCNADLSDLTLGTACPTCAVETAHGGTCRECERRPPPFSATQAALRYDAPLDMLVTHFKFGGGWQLAEFLSALALPRLDLAELGDFAVPVPLHPRREHSRGFNQSREIARRLCRKRTGGGEIWAEVPLKENWIARVMDTPRQTAMSGRKERRMNVRGAFAASPEVRGQRIVVVDDVMTSGATLEEIARVLKRAGAAEVNNAVLGRAQPYAL